jgi:hypothetical protein
MLKSCQGDSSEEEKWNIGMMEQWKAKKSEYQRQPLLLKLRRAKEDRRKSASRKASLSQRR